MLFTPLLVNASIIDENHLRDKQKCWLIIWIIQIFLIKGEFWKAAATVSL